MPAPGASPSYRPWAASGESSRNGAPGVEQPVDALARQQLAAARVARAGLLAAAGAHALELRAQVGDQRLVGRAVGRTRRSDGLHPRERAGRGRPGRPTATAQLGRRRRPPGAVIESSIFIDSRTTTGSAGRDGVPDRGRDEQDLAGHRGAQLAVGARTVTSSTVGSAHAPGVQPSRPSHSVSPSTARPRAAAVASVGGSRSTSTRRRRPRPRSRRPTGARTPPEAPAVDARERVVAAPRGSASATAPPHARPPPRSSAARACRAAPSAACRARRRGPRRGRAGRAGSRRGGDPSTAVSASARSRRASAVSRSCACAMTFAISES